MPSDPSRIFETKRRIRVGDCDTTGTVRVDALARFLQDVGYDDTEDIGVGDGGLWVARSIAMRFPNKSKMPKRNEWVNLETYCSGIGYAFAQRTVNIYTNLGDVITTNTIWVSIDSAGKPVSIPLWLSKEYPDALKMKATKTLPLPMLEEESVGHTIDWKIRAADIDVNGHANNALAFSALFEAANILRVRPPSEVLVEYHLPLVASKQTDLFMVKSGRGFDAWLVSDHNIAAVMRWTCD